MNGRPNAPLADVPTEKALLAELILRPERMHEVGSLCGGHFFLVTHRLIFDVVRNLFLRGTKFDSVSVARLLRQKGERDACVLLADILNSPVVLDLRHHAEAVVEYAARRRLRDGNALPDSRNWTSQEA